MNDTTIKKTGLELLREPFQDHQIGVLPKPRSKDSAKGYCNECGGYHGLPAVHLDYVGHAAVTDRLLDADPAWSWEPLAFDADGLPAIDKNGGLWIKLTVLGVTRLGYGDADGKSGPNAMKERIGDALRNAAMRFGVALDLWHKGDLHADKNDGEDTDAHGEPVGPRDAAPSKPREKAPEQPAGEPGPSPMASSGQLAWLKKKLAAVGDGDAALKRHGISSIERGITVEAFDLVKADLMKG